MNVLHLTYVPDDDWHGELQASAEAFGFVGYSSGWFTRERLMSFATSLQAYPMTVEDAPLLSDQIVGSDGVAWAHDLRLRIGPVTKTGILMVDLELAAEPYASIGYLRQSCRLNFPTDYASLDRFRAAFVAMLDQGGAADLVGSEL